MRLFLPNLLTSIDALTSAIRVVPTGGRRSALATAALYELLHKTGSAADGAGRFTHVLLVRSQPGQSQQLVENRPLLFKDRFSTVVDISVSYMLIDTSGSEILAADTVTSTAKAFGTIGEKPTVVVAPQGG